MTFLTHFFIAFGLSFVGSLPFGMINMSVARTAINMGMRVALAAAIGASIVELVQVFVALKLTSLFAENISVKQTFIIIATVAIFIGGIFFLFFAKPVKYNEKGDAAPSRMKGFLSGVSISLLNLIVIPYWMGYATYLTATGELLWDNGHIIAFTIGAATGTFALLVCYALLGAKILSKSEQVAKWVNKFIGLVLIGIGVLQVLKLAGVA